jgi:hypothetical protein
MLLGLSSGLLFCSIHHNHGSLGSAGHPLQDPSGHFLSWMEFRETSAF